MTRVNAVPVCSLVDFYRCIPDYEDVMHLPSHELDERLRDLRTMQKSYLSDGRSSPLLSDPRSDSGYLREDFRDFVLGGSEYCPRVCPYASPIPVRSPKYRCDKLLATNYQGAGREAGISTIPKDHAVTTPSTPSNKSSAAFSVDDPPLKCRPTRARRNRPNKCVVKNVRPTSIWPPPSHFGSPPPPPLYPSGSPSFPEDFDCDELYGPSWVDSHPPKHAKEQRSLPCSPAHRRLTKNANADKHTRSRLLSYLSTPNVRVAEEKPGYVFRAQPFPSHIFSNYLTKRTEEKITNRAVSKRARAEDVRKSASATTRCRRRQKGSAITIRSEPPKASQDTHPRSSPPSRYHDLSPYRKTERRSFGTKRRSRPTSVEARDNLASLLRLQASRLKLEAESAAATELAASCAEKRVRNRAMRLSPVWHSALSRPTTAEELMLKAARRREEAAERKRRRRRSVAAMRERVRAAPTLMERQSLIRTVSSLGGYSGRDSTLKSSKQSAKYRRSATAEAWRCYSNNHNGYSRSHTQLSSFPPRRRRSRVVISHKNSFSDDEVQRKCRQNLKGHRKDSILQPSELYDDTPEDDFELSLKQQSRPSSPFKSRSCLDHSPSYAYGSHQDHSDDLSDEENVPYSLAAGGRMPRADLSFSDSHGEDSQIAQNAPSDVRNDRKQTEQSHETNFSKSVSRDFEFGAKTHFPPFLKSETWPSASPKGTDCYERSLSLGHEGTENGRLEGLTRRFQDISLRSSSPSREPREASFEEAGGSGRNQQPCFSHFRSTQSSPQLKRRNLQHYKTFHDSMMGLDLASQKEYFNDGNLRFNVRSPRRHFVQTRSSDKPVSHQQCPLQDTL